MSFYEIVEKSFALERAGRQIVRLNIGDTNLPAPECATRAAIAALSRGRSGYGPAAGLPVLRERIARREGCGVENVVVGPGSKQILFALMSVLGRPGARVAIPSPAWPAYELIAKQLGMVPVTLPSSLATGWQYDLAPARGCSLFVVCNPLNPTSTLITPELMVSTVAEAKRSGGHLLIDEAYRGLAFEEVPRPDGAIRLRTFSKEFNMEGWRLGYAIAPADVIREVVRFNQISVTCVADFVQEAGAACLAEEEAILTRNRALWRERVDACAQALRRAGFELAYPQAGMYLFATHPDLQDADALALRLLDRGVGVAPGSGFGDFPRFVRICANQEVGVLEDAIERMAAALAG